MAENETQENNQSDTAVAEIPYNIRVEDFGPPPRRCLSRFQRKK